MAETWQIWSAAAAVLTALGLLGLFFVTLIVGLRIADLKSDFGKVYLEIVRYNREMQVVTDRLWRLEWAKWGEGSMPRLPDRSAPPETAAAPEVQ